jgi:uncharacterized protein
MLEDRIYADYIKAVKERDKPKREFLSFLRSCLKNKAIDLKKDKLDDSQALEVLDKEKKKLIETKESIKGSEKAEQIKDVEYEINIIDAFLPQPLTQEEVSQIIDKAIKQEKAESVKDMGRVMKKVLAQTLARANSKQVSLIVRERLSKSC